MDRTEGIGGSDWGHVLDVAPYWCRRRLWYEKRGVAPDFSDTETAAMTRGKALEGEVCRLYVSERVQQGVRVRLVQPRKVKRVKPDWWVGHVDRLVQGDPRGVGVLECKTAGAYVYRKIRREGAPVAYAAQLMHYLHLHGCDWGALAILWPDGWELTVIEQQFDADLHQAMLEAGHDFMRGDEPPRKESGYSGCKTCPWRLTCQGADLMPSVESGEIEVVQSGEFEALLRQERELALLAVETEEAREGVRTKIKEALGEREVVECGNYRIYHRTQTQKRLDTVRLRREQPSIASLYETSVVARPLAIYERKG